MKTTIVINPYYAMLLMEIAYVKTIIKEAIKEAIKDAPTISLDALEEGLNYDE